MRVALGLPTRPVAASLPTLGPAERALTAIAALPAATPWAFNAATFSRFCLSIAASLVRFVLALFLLQMGRR